jgi:CspA family cold shock protein
VDAVVKWFKPDKGFGFVEILDGSGDAFLHIKVLQALGPDAVLAGAKLTVVVDEGQRGRHVSQVIAVHSSTPDSYPVPRSGPQEPGADTGVELLGILKWFSETKGMGFIADESGGEDVFVHITALRAARLSNLSEGQHVLTRVIETGKGRKATFIALAD